MTRTTQATPIGRRAKHLRAGQPLEHAMLESMVQCLGIGADDALEISEATRA